MTIVVIGALRVNITSPWKHKCNYTSAKYCAAVFPLPIQITAPDNDYQEIYVYFSRETNVVGTHLEAPLTRF